MVLLSWPLAIPRTYCRHAAGQRILATFGIRCFCPRRSLLQVASQVTESREHGLQFVDLSCLSASTGFDGFCLHTFGHVDLGFPLIFGLAKAASSARRASAFSKHGEWSPEFDMQSRNAATSRPRLGSFVNATPWVLMISAALKSLVQPQSPTTERRVVLRNLHGAYGSR